MRLLVAIAAGILWSVTPGLAGDEPPASELPPSEPPKPASVVEKLTDEAAKLRPLVKTEAVRALLDGAARLPEPTARTIHRAPDGARAYSQREFDALDAELKRGLKPRTFEPPFYYFTGYGTPLIYARALDLVAERAGWAGADGFKSKRIMDFGYGLIGHLRLLAMRGADVTGIEVEPVLRALYSEPGDTGRIDGPDGVSGQLRVLHGRWPADEPLAAEVAAGGGYDLIISKNVLKRGYIHPAREADKRLLVNLGVDDRVFVERLHAALKPGGWLMIYNIAPAQNSVESGKPYMPHADGECPFPRQMLEDAGFDVLAFDEPDHAAVIDIWMTLGINQGRSREVVAGDLFAYYTLARRKG